LNFSFYSKLKYKNPSAAILILLVLILFFLIFNNNAGAVTYESYSYNFWGEVISSPHAFIPYKVLGGDDLGIEVFDRPEDIHTDENNQIYVVDRRNDRIIHIGEDYQLVREINEFYHDEKGKQDTFDNPTGIAVDVNNDIYVADRGNNRVVHLREDETLKQEIILTDEDEMIREGFNFRPLKLDVDHTGRIFVISEGEYEGLLLFSQEGAFEGFIGAPSVTPDLFDYFWRNIVATEAQRDRMALHIPIQFNNLHVDSSGFIFAVASGGTGYVAQEELIRRLNPGGEDVLRREGFHAPIGEVEYTRVQVGAIFVGIGASRFIDITHRDDVDIYSAMDRRRGRIYTYDNQGRLLYTFGGQGDNKGVFREPIALEYLNDGRMVVLDNRTGLLTFFRETNYAQNFHQAMNLYNDGRYDNSYNMWKQTLRKNINHPLIHTYLGLSLYRMEEYNEALTHFRLGQDRNNYSRAFEYHRREIIRENFDLIIYILLFFTVVSVVVYKFRVLDKISRKVVAVTAETTADITEDNLSEQKSVKKIKYFLIKTFNGLKYGGHVIFHPFDGFWSLKHERKGNLLSSLVILIIFLLSYLHHRIYSGFLFNELNLATINIFNEIISVLIPLMLWVIVNWALSTLLDGKGTLLDIFNAVSYSLVPFILVNIPLTIISEFLLLEEASFYYFFAVLSVFWCFGLIFFGLLVIHDYTLSKNIFLTIFTIIGMASSVFIGLLFYSVIELMFTFVHEIYVEVVYRY